MEDWNNGVELWEHHFIHLPSNIPFFHLGHEWLGKTYG